MRDESTDGRSFPAEIEPLPERAARRRVGPASIAVGLALIVGLGGWMTLRVRTAVTSQKEVAAQRTEVARAAAENAQRPSGVRTVRGIAESWAPRVTFEGTLAPVREADLGFKAGGRIASIRVKVGDTVKAGEVLATLESTEADAQLRASEAQVRAAEAQLALASDVHTRTDALVKAGGVAEASGVQSQNQRALAAAQLDGARAQAALARVALGNHTLAAPFAGVVTRAPVGVGAVVGPGIPQLHVSDLATLKLVGTVGEQDAALVRPGETIELQLEGKPVYGKVVSVLASVDPATRRVPVEALVANAGEATGGAVLRAGSFARASIAGGAPIAVLRLPREALRPGAQDEVMTVKNGVLAGKRLAFVIGPDGALLVRAGLAPDDAVVLSPSPEAKDGDKVQVLP